MVTACVLVCSTAAWLGIVLASIVVLANRRRGPERQPRYKGRGDSSGVGGSSLALGFGRLGRRSGRGAPRLSYGVWFLRVPVRFSFNY